MTMSEMIRKLHDFFRIFTRSGLNISEKDPQVRADYYASNLPFAITAGILICMLSLIGLIGTFAPYSEGFVLRGITATAVYFTIFLTNGIFILLLYRETKRLRIVGEKWTRMIYAGFLSANMVLASLTFYTTQANSSFFFEYILVTITVLIVPNTEFKTFLWSGLINALSVVLVLHSFHRMIAWQDVVDMITLFIICGLVNWVRWLSFLRSETNKFLIEKEKDEYYHDSRTDGLTGLMNRTGLRSDFLMFLGRRVCVAMLDLDSFKQYNDTFGHDRGDEILRLTGSRLQESFSETTDRCYRYGGDEFLVLSIKGDPEGFRAKLSEFRKLCDGEQDGMRTPCSIGFCMGIPHSERELRGLIKIADDYLYQAKSEYENKIRGSVGVITAGPHLSVDSVEEDVQRRKERFLQERFRAALTSGQIVPYYQPVVGSLSGMTCGYEALSRWIDPEKGMIPPGEYIPYLEKTGEVYRLDLEILEQVCRNIHDHREQFSDKIFVNINLSQTDFQFADIPEAIRRIVSKYGIAAGQIQLEITESAFADSRILGDALNKLQKDGFRIWMDDFGVGESSLSTLRSDQIKGVKLDQSFFADIENPRTQIIIRSVIDLSHETHCMIIAEGIENREQERCAQQWGVNFIQGYYHSKPLPFEELMNSSFVRNQTDENTDQYYRAAVEANLSLAYQPEFYIRDGSPAFFGSAVLECGDKLRILRMNDQMKAYLGDVVRENRSGYVLDENSVVVTVLKNAAEEAEKRGRPVDFRMDLKNRRLYGQIAGLAENPGCGKTAFVLHLSDFFLATE